MEGDVVDSSVTPHEVIIEEAGQKVYQQGIAKDFRVKGKGVVEFEEVVKVLFEKPNLNKLVHIKPLYLCAKIALKLKERKQEKNWLIMALL